MKLLRLISILLTIGVFSCNSVSGKTENSAETTKVEDTVTKTENPQPAKQTEENQYVGNCVRGQAEPIVKRNVYPNTTFALQSDKLTSYETVTFGNKDKLIIYNWGCEYYMLTFRFETSRFQEDVNNLAFWYLKAHILMTEIRKGLDTPFVTIKELTTLKKITEKKIDCSEDDSEIRNFITVDKIEKLTEKKYAIEISFSTGPL